MLQTWNRTFVKRMAFLAFASMLLAACTQQPKAEQPPAGSATQTGTPAPQPTGTYKIGVIAPLTGQISSLGAPMVAGMKFRLDQFNKAGILKKPIELVIENDESVEANTVTLTKRMIDNKDILFLMGFTGSALCLAATDTTNREGIMNVCVAASERITNPAKKWTFTNFPHGRMESQTVLQWFKNQGTTKLAVVYEDSAFGQSGAAAMKEEAGKYGIQVVATESFLQADRDMTAQLTRARAAGAQAIMSWDTTQTGAAVQRGVKQLGIEVPVVHASGSASTDFIQLSSAAANGAFAITDGLAMVREDLPDSHPRKAALKKAAEEYKAVSGKEIDVGSAGGNEAVELAFEAIRILEQSGKEINRPNMRDAWESIKGYQGVNGVYNYSPENHTGITNATNILYVQDGKWRLYLTGEEINSGKAKK